MKLIALEEAFWYEAAGRLHRVQAPGDVISEHPRRFAGLAAVLPGGAPVMTRGVPGQAGRPGSPQAGPHRLAWR